MNCEELECFLLLYSSNPYGNLYLRKIPTRESSPLRDVMKKYSENIRQSYRRAPMPLY